MAHIFGLFQKNLWRNYWRFISFSFLFIFFSSLGQTFLISLFIPYFCDHFSLTTLQFASLYAFVTMISAFSLPFLGSQLDKVDLLKFTSFCTFLLISGILLIIFSPYKILSYFGLLLLRFSGQGLFGHLASTSIARFEDQVRGKLLAVTSLGYPLSEAIMPSLTIFLFSILSWKNVLLLYGSIVVLVVVPFTFRLVRHSQNFRKLILPSQNPLEVLNTKITKTLLRKLLMISPVYMMAPTVMTALFFHQVSLAQIWNINMETMASSFITFAFCQMFATLFIGYLIDQYSAQKLFPFFLSPMILSLILMTFFPSVVTLYVYMALLGITASLGSNLRTAILAEIVPLLKLGMYKSFGASLTVLSTALGPVIYSVSEKSGATYQQQFLTLAILALIASVISFYGLNQKK